MSKRDQREEARREGIAFAVRFLEKAQKEHNSSYDCIEMLKEEAKKRGAYDIPVGLDKKEVDEFSLRVKQNVLDCVLALSTLVLNDEFDFGKKRLERFINRFNKKSECILENYTTWEETLGILKDERGIKLNIRWNGGDPTKGVNTDETD